MSYLVNSTTLKKKFCNHEFRRKYKQHSNECYDVCCRCNLKRKPKPKNKEIISFLQPASKQSKTDFVEENKFLSNWNEVEHMGYKLPATEEPHYWCGIWETLGCLDVEAHKHSSFKNKIFVRQFQRSCFRPGCDKCYRKWIGRQANKATTRLEEYEKISGRRARHVILSVPKWDYGKEVNELKQESRQILRDISCIGGAMIFHPFRFNKTKREFYYSPHFHVVGFGKIRGITKDCNRRGWFIKSMGRRKSTFHTFHYLLSHCGIKKGSHALTWFGDLSYSKLHVEIEANSGVCPLCSQRLVPIYYDGVHPVVPPDQNFEGFLDPFDWYVVKTEEKSEWTKQDRYDYALEKELFEANSGI